MFTRYHIIRTEQELNRLIQACIKTGYACVDFETNAKGIYEDEFKPTILSVTFQVGSGCSIPLQHFDDSISFLQKNNLWLKWLVKFGRKVIENPNVTKIAHNWKFDNQIFVKYGIYARGTVIDSMLAKHILNEEKPHGLKPLVSRYLPEFADYQKYEKFEEIPWEKKPLEPLARYGCMDTDFTFRLAMFFESKLINLGFYNLYRNLPMAASRVLQSAETFGLPIDLKFNDELQIKYAKLIKEGKEEIFNLKVIRKFEKKLIASRKEEYINKLYQEIEDLKSDPKKARQVKSREEKISRIIAGEYVTKAEKALVEPLNFNSTPQMVALLYSEIGLNLPVIEYTKDKHKKPTNTPSTSAETLEKLKDKDKYGFIEKLLNLRGLEKMNSTYIVGLRELIQSDNRVHPTFLIIGTTSGRLSSKNPNGQNIPKTMVNPDIKKQFIPPKNELFLTYDYSQAELRILAHLAKEDTMLEWFRTGKDIHLASACKKYHEDYEKILPIYLDEQHPEYKIWKKRRKQAKCFSGDTEILTESGWQRFDSYNGDKVAQYNMENQAITFVTPLNYGRVRSGSVMSYEDRNISLLLTSNHECLFRTRHGKLIKDEIFNLKGRSGYMISAGYYSGEYESELFTRILAMVVSDGNIRPDTIRFGFKKNRKITRCRELLTQAGIKFQEYTKKNQVTRFIIRDFNLYKRISQYVNKEKVLYWKSLFKLNGKIYLDEARRWDGHTDSKFSQDRASFSSSVETTLDVMQAMGVIHGIRVIKHDKHISYRPDGKTDSRVNLDNLAFVSGNQFMYCVSVPDTNIIIRRNGKPSIQGNCINFGVCYEQTAMNLATTLETSVDEAQQFLDEFFETFPKIRKFIDRQHKFMEKNGYCVSLFGRRRRCPGVYSEKYGEYLEALRQATNAPVQSAASDMALFASVIVYEKVKRGELPPMIEVNTVHDSVYQFILPKYLTPDLIYQIWDICRNPSTKKYFGFQITDIDMSMDFTVGRTMAEELPYIPGYDYNKLLSPNFDIDEYYAEHKKVRDIEIKEYPEKFKTYFEESWRKR